MALEKETHTLKAGTVIDTEELRQKIARGEQELKNQSATFGREADKHQKVVEDMESQLQKQKQLVNDLENKLTQRLLSVLPNPHPFDPTNKFFLLFCSYFQITAAQWWPT